MNAKVALALVVAVCSLVSLPQASAQQLSDEQFGKLMDSYLQKPENMEKVSNALQRYFLRKQEQQREAALEDQFKNPVKIEIGKSPVKGPADAKVTIVEFSEFQCPFCRQGAQTMDQVLAAYPKDVKHVFKNLPLPMHNNAKSSCVAALAAGRQGKYWEMHDKLFANQQRLGSELYNSLAQELGLDLAKFKADLEDPALAKQVDEEKALADKLGVHGTPGYFINGVQLSGAQPFPAFKQIIDRWVERKNN